MCGASPGDLTGSWVIDQNPWITVPKNSGQTACADRSLKLRSPASQGNRCDPSEATRDCNTSRLALFLLPASLVGSGQGVMGWHPRGTACAVGNGGPEKSLSCVPIQSTGNRKLSAAIFDQDAPRVYLLAVVAGCRPLPATTTMDTSIWTLLGKPGAVSQRAAAAAAATASSVASAPVSSSSPATADADSCTVTSARFSCTPGAARADDDNTVTSVQFPCAPGADTAESAGTAASCSSSSVLLPIACSNEEVAEPPPAVGDQQSHLFGGLYDVLDGWGDGRMNGSVTYGDHDSQAVEHRHRKKAARRDRSRSRGRQGVASGPVFFPARAESFGAACRQALAGWPRAQEALVDLTGGTTSMEAALAACHRRVRAESHSYYIGITENPSRRFEEHCSAGSWARMVLLAKASSSRETSYMERSLISTFKDAYRCMNIAPGGERASEGSPHYLYLLVGHSALLRRAF